MRFIYAMFAPFSLSLMWRFKVGIAADVKQRAAQIKYDLQRTVGGKVKLYYLSMPVWFPESTETRLHRWFDSAKAKVPYHRGHTEWFAVRNQVATLAFIAYCGQTGQPPEWWHVGLVYIAPVPLDGFLAVLAAFVFQAAAALFVLYLCYAGATGVFSTIF